MEEFNIKDLFNFFIKRIWIIIMCSLLTLVIGEIYYKCKQNVYYVADTKLLMGVNESINTTEDVIPSTSEVSSFCKEKVISEKLLTNVIKDLNLNTDIEDLKNNISIVSDNANYTVQISFKSKDSDEAIKIANSITSYLYEEVKNNYSHRNVIILSEATSAVKIKEIDHTKVLIIFFILGGFIGTGTIFILFYFDDKIRNINNLEDKFKIPVVGCINDYNHLNRDTLNCITESIRILRMNIQSKCDIDNSKIIMITSSKENEGKDFIASKLAYAFGEIQKKILIIDCDFKTGTLHDILNTNNDIGISNLLINKKCDYKKYIKNTNMDYLDFISKGTNVENNNLFESNIADEVFDNFKKLYDCIIIVTPHIANNSTPLVLAQKANKVYIVSRMNFTKESDIETTKKALKNVGVDMSGIIVNDMR